MSEAVAGGASTCKQVAAACGAGMDCGRCLRNLKAMVEKATADRALADTVAVAS